MLIVGKISSRWGFCVLKRVCPHQMRLSPESVIFRLAIMILRLSSGN